MPRKPRVNGAGIPHHIIQRGINKRNCFNDEMDKLNYLSILSEYAIEHEVLVHSYVLMSNHIHLLVTPKTSQGVSLFIQAVGRKYVPYFNKRHQRTGSLWEGRFKSCLIDTDNYFLAVSRYIELNPVRASMVEVPGDYYWSSYRINANGYSSNMITFHSSYLALGSDDSSRQRAYKELFENELTMQTMTVIRSRVNAGSSVGTDPLGI